MKRTFRITLILLFISICNVAVAAFSPNAYAFEPEVEEIKQENMCADSEFGVQFYCQADWKWKRVDDAILIIISEDPTVTLTISKVSTPIKFLSQLSNHILIATGLYEEGFKTVYSTIDGKKVLNVKAFSAYDQNIRLDDYYFIHHNGLYGILFSVNPKESWKTEQFLIQEIRESFQFID